MDSWRIWIDTGGTFTDCLALDPSGHLHRLKILSQGMLRGKVTRLVSSTILQVELRWPVSTDIYSNYHLTLGANRKRPIKVVRVDTEKGLIEVNSPIRHKVSGIFFDLSTPEEVPVFATRLLTRTPIGQPFPSIQMKLGSTRGTNAILEKKGAKTALLITRGFKDLLLIGTQQRPELFALQIRKEMPLYHLVIEVDERMDSQGSVMKKWNKAESEAIIRVLKKKKIESIAVAFLNSYRNPKHEYMLKRELQKAGYFFISTSQELSKQVKILQRAETTLANAYLDPIIRTYVQNILSGQKNVNLKMMTSAGSLVDAVSFHPKDSLLSGPAGGVVGAAMKAHLSGIDQLITFDMGGTSTDVSRYDRRFDYRYESKVGTLKILSPSLAIETIAAGGGSICSYDDYRFQVGPESAGASPGPACYGSGGPLTITDVNLLLGRIAPKHFAIPLSREKAQEALHVLIKKVKSVTGRNYTEVDLLLSFIQIANEKMADAIRQVSTQSGHNPAAYTLLSFGGAGGQHACSLANMLGIKRVMIPYDAGLLSAFGIGHAKVERFKERLVLMSIEEAGNQVKGIIDDLFHDGLNELLEDGYMRSQIILSKQLAFIRFKGQESPVEIDFSGSDFNTEVIRNQFREQYGKIFGHWLTHHEIELESIRIVVSILEIPPSPDLSKIESYQPVPVSSSRLITDKGSTSSALYSWEELRPGATLAGPALITSNNSTTLVDKGWHFFLDANNNATLTRKEEIADLSNHSKEAALELFTNRYTAIAREMGALLQRTSFSVNVKERLDFSCAVLDRGGFLVVNAPHIPVHLGSMGVCVREVVSRVVVSQGDVLITNHPAFGGSHLPDITLIKPVFFDKKLIGYVANRAHHAEIGGKKPGSMPADATLLEEEGVIILPDHLVKAGSPKWNKIQELFTQSKYPTRSWEENRADLNGALASVNYGERAIQELCQKFGKNVVTRHMLLLRKYAAQVFHNTLQALPDRKYEAEEKLDDGSPLKVSIQKKYGNLIVDFSGSSSVHPGNLNATKAIVQSVVLYVLRLLVDQPIPMNEGLMDHVKMILPHGLLNPDFSKISPPAVVGGNTEVSQRLTDTLLKALGLVACSQGTMNNFLFGNQHFGYYETICGGTGAGKGFHGADAVHQHMTNTRITDPELLELRYPVILKRFEIRKNSGGGGKWKGGEGVTREVLFNEVLDINILSQHRQERPYGLQGGLPGKTGTQKIIRKNGKVEVLKGMDSAKVYPGDRFIIETPGGGGFGK